MRLEDKLANVLKYIYSMHGKYPNEVAMPGGFHLPVWRMRGPIKPDATVREYDILVSEIRGSGGMWAYRLNRDDVTGMMFDPDEYAKMGHDL